MEIILSYMPAIFIILIILVLVIANIKIVPQNICFLTEFLGKYKSTWQAGIHIKIPFLERISAKVSLKEQVFDYPPQTVITKDNVSIDQKSSRCKLPQSEA